MLKSKDDVSKKIQNRPRSVSAARAEKPDPGDHGAAFDPDRNLIDSQKDKKKTQINQL